MSRRPSSRPPTGEGRPQTASPDSSNQASGEPGAVHRSDWSGPCQCLADSTPHVPRPRCGRSLLSGRAGWAVRTDDTGPSPAQRPRSVVTTSRSSPMVGHHVDNLPKCTCGGTGEHPLVLVLPSQPTSTLALDQLPRRPGGEAPPQPVRVRYGGPDPPSTLVRATHGQRSTIPPFRPHAGRRPRRPRTTATRRTHCPNGGGPPTEPFHGPARFGQRGCRAADTGDPSVRTHLHGTGRVDTGRVDTGRPLDRLDSDVRTADRARGQGDHRRGRRPDILATGDQPLGGQTSPGSQRLVALGQP